MPKKKSSSYTSQYFTGDNILLAENIGDMMTWNHSEKIKFGNQLETYILNDIKDECKLPTVKGLKIVSKKSKKKNFLTLDEFKALDISDKSPLIVNSFRIDKKLYLENGLSCSNKTGNEIDFAFITKNSEGIIDIKIIEVKSGCDFDTKKSKGEIQTLTATSQLFIKNGFTSSSYIMSWDALEVCDIKIKTELKDVKLILYSEMIEFINNDGHKSKSRILEKTKKVASKRLKTLKNKMKKILEMLSNEAESKPRTI